MRASRVLDRLRSPRQAGARDRAVAAVEQACAYEASPEEEVWLDRIEAARRRLEADDRVLRTPRHEYTGDQDHEEVFEEVLGDFCVRSSKPREAGTLLFALVRLLRPRRALELGTGLGISGAYQAAALRLNGRGRLTTIEAASARVAVAREVFAELGLSDVVDSRCGRFQEIVPDVLRGGPVAYAFVDGHHEQEATLEYVDLIAQHLAPGGVVVVDDIAWSDGMASAWRTVRADDRVESATEALAMGISVYR